MDPANKKTMTDRIRIDKWLWHARFYRTRALAQDAANSGLIRLNARRVEKPSVEVKPGDLLTLPRGREIVVVRVLMCGIRRGSARDAALLYETLTDGALDPGRPEP
jgi:ribosome-associated heat shock protein Hsp15